MLISLKNDYYCIFLYTGLISLLIFCRISLCQHLNQHQHKTSWRMDVKFDVPCASMEFVLLGYMSFNGQFVEKKSGRQFPRDDREPFLYDELDVTPDLSTAKIGIGIELRVETWNADKGPRNIEDLLISLNHVGLTLKLRIQDIPLRNDTPDFTHLSTRMIIYYEDFKVQTKNDCFFEQTYYVHGEVATNSYQCLNTILICRCDNGKTSTNCRLLPQKCFINGAQFDRETVDTVCNWKMSRCCPEIDCPVKPLAYCLNHSEMPMLSLFLFFFVILLKLVVNFDEL